MAQINMLDITKRFGDLEVISSTTLEINDGEFAVFVGPSGCGKSTLLRLLAGLDELTSGEIRLNNQRIDHLAPAKRGLAMVFQSYALYPHMSVYQNMSYSLKVAKEPKNVIDEKVKRAADILQLGEYLDRKPKELSGGQRQRVAIGRAIVREPKVFLFDEPLSNLDAKLRVQMRIELTKLHKALKTTMIYVTHDQVEAMTMADRIIVMNSGVIEQIGTPSDIYRNPASTFVASFMGARMAVEIPGLQQPALRLIHFLHRFPGGEQISWGFGLERSDVVPDAVQLHPLETTTLRYITSHGINIYAFIMQNKI